MSTVTTRKGAWFQTYTGSRFYPEDPRPGDFDILDIAVGLSNTCRYNGHVRDFYSVAQHSFIVSQEVPAEIALEGLLHDAAEAYIGDVIRPLKLALPDYRKVEDAVEKAISEQFGLQWPWPMEVKVADNAVLMTERRDLLMHQLEWNRHEEPLERVISPWRPDDARRAFLARYHHLEELR